MTFMSKTIQSFTESILFFHLDILTKKVYFMEVIMSETILERMEGRVSYHDSVEEMLKRIRDDGLSSVFSRWENQEKIRCKYC
ncbi:MAG: carbon-monoxide dehydrogenase, catalytic subunit, partial [Anaerocolumna sp.]|nr:carbon-monoxide dehydrogenase, catalytic subunit [Anaerocolumna sp.]